MLSQSVKIDVPLENGQNGKKFIQKMIKFNQL